MRFYLSAVLSHPIPHWGIDSVKQIKRLPVFLDEERAEELVESPASGVDKDNVLCARDAAMFEVLYSTGIRVSSLVGLNVEDYFPTESVVQVRAKGGRQQTIPVGENCGRYPGRLYGKTRRIVVQTERAERSR